MSSVNVVEGGDTKDMLGVICACHGKGRCDNGNGGFDMVGYNEDVCLR